ncbi:hypothetical protein M9458_008375, partial [Cirrhinus mrigala]
ARGTRKDGEDIRGIVINILGNVVPGISERMEEAVDIARILARHAEKGWYVQIYNYPSARDCKFLRDNKLRFTEALSPEDRVAGEKLWPLVKKARDEGKKASFHGSFALIDGKRFEYA